MTMCLSTNGQVIYRSAEPPSKLLVSTLDGVDVLERDGPDGEWSLTGHVLDDHHVSSLMIEPVNQWIFAGVHWGGLFRSKDDGATWEPCMNGITKEHVYSLAYVVTEDGPILYAGSEPVSIFRSFDLGDTWEEQPAIGEMPGHDKWNFPPPPHWAHTKSFEFDPRDPGVLYVGIEQGALMKSADGGVSWRELESFHREEDQWHKDIHRVVCKPGNPDELIMATGMGLYLSDDAGETWEHITDPKFVLGYPDQLILSPDDDNLVYASGAGFDPTVWRHSGHAAGTVLRSRDGGRSWEDASKGLPQDADSNIEAMNAAIYDGGMTLFAGNTDGEVYESADGAESWRRIVSGLKAVSKGNHSHIINVEYAEQAGQR